MGGFIYVITKIIYPILRWILIYFINLQEISQKNINGIQLIDQTTNLYLHLQKKFLEKYLKFIIKIGHQTSKNLCRVRN